jgi:hypothetical protein
MNKLSDSRHSNESALSTWKDLPAGVIAIGGKDPSRMTEKLGLEQWPR